MSSKDDSKLEHSTIQNGWFKEVNENWPGQALELRVDRILHTEQSQFQDVLVFKSTDYGNVLVLDGVINVTERDEFAYQEMIAHVPLMCHSNPKKVLVIGGGDGGVLREIAKHKSVETIELVEIDEAVIRMSKTYFPKMAVGFDDSRVTVHITDGFEFLRQKKGEYDVIISDTSDPEGPAEQLFQLGYFKLLNEALTDNGVISMQASENVWLKIKVLEELKKTCKQVFPSVAYTAAIMPTYTSGQLGLMICSKDRSQDVSVPRRWWPEEDEKQLLRYYNRQIHSASFTLQTFAKKFIG